MSTNVLANDFSMKSYSSQALQFPNAPCDEIDQSTFGIEEQNRFQFILGIAICFLAMAILFVPERPHEFASICEKYNTTNACQIW
ncbi:MULTISPECIES: hypothetical protein [unclassified Prochlorococcus]|uniref:hypothetical protein n=2 Tax=Prochlorococcus TaxID=1218 RepID=UPI000560D143